MNQNICKEIKIGDKKYPLAFDINVCDAIQKAYGRLEIWGNHVAGSDGNEFDISALKFGLCEAINEGIEIYNEFHDEKMDLIDERQAGIIMTMNGLKETSDLLTKSLCECLEIDENDLPKNE